MSDLKEIRFVKRIVIGTAETSGPQIDEASEQQIELLNRCLSDSPRGWIIGLEKTLSMVDVAGRQESVQGLVYHIGFPRKPHWLSE
ncbi:putative uncharacterized protein [Pseudomonas sp. StFLB209]|uniref:hypothetical protein n=1 Tax=Pseudomonas sp. StFLB209 TaxID=1028989 RepID=UPI0004F762F2|nr:hypothetical protein [Pseudomonas sp. StFLB209]BAP40769.1 putative uncharacterized protein [Pseudomonas sp. StFLB209]